MNVKNYIIFLFILITLGLNPLKAQSSVEVIESYIIDKNIESNLERRVIPNQRFKEILLDEYYQTVDPLDLEPDQLDIYHLIQAEFNFNHLDLQNYKTYDYRLKQEVKKPTKYQFSTIIFSKYKNYAIFYAEERCKSMCSNGNIILMELVNGEWRYRATIYAWME